MNKNKQKVEFNNSDNYEKNKMKQKTRMYVNSDMDEFDNNIEQMIDKIKQINSVKMDPTIDVQLSIANVIYKYIKDKGRILYGGTALNDILINKKGISIYKKYDSPDIDFYSPKPYEDAVELCELLNKHKFKNVTAIDALHEDTIKIFVDYKDYCDITWVPQRIYNSIDKLVINSINYAHPHFLFIDQLRIVNQPLTSAELRWKKTFKRMCLLTDFFPFENFIYKIPVQKMEPHISNYISLVRSNFLKETAEIDNGDKNINDSDINDSNISMSDICLVSGFDAYNFYVRESQTNLTDQIQVPYLEFISVKYKISVKTMYNYLKKIVKDINLLEKEEYFPFFQFTGNSIIFKYDGIPIVKIYDMQGYCIPYNEKNSVMYVSYTYLLMMLMISKFLAYVDKNKEYVKVYKALISNILDIRNSYLLKNKLTILDNSIFQEFKISCVGKTVDFMKESRNRKIAQAKKGKKPFRYDVDSMNEHDTEEREKILNNVLSNLPMCKNISGFTITKKNNQLFSIEDGNIVYNYYKKSDTNDSDKQERIIDINLVDIDGEY